MGEKIGGIANIIFDTGKTGENLTFLEIGLPHYRQREPFLQKQLGFFYKDMFFGKRASCPSDNDKQQKWQ